MDQNALITILLPAQSEFEHALVLAFTSVPNLNDLVMASLIAHKREREAAGNCKGRQRRAQVRRQIWVHGCSEACGTEPGNTLEGVSSIVDENDVIFVHGFK